MVSHNVSEGVELRNMTKLHWAKGFSILKPVTLHAVTASVLADDLVDRARVATAQGLRQKLVHFGARHF